MLSNAVFLHSAIVVDVIRVEIFDKNHRHHRKVLITYSWYLLGYECCFIFYCSYPFSGGTAKSLSRTQAKHSQINYGFICNFKINDQTGEVLFLLIKNKNFADYIQ